MTAVAFSDEASAIVEASREEAGRLGHAYVGTEHLALAMVAADDPTLTQLFDRAGISYQAARDLTGTLLGSPHWFRTIRTRGIQGIHHALQGRPRRGHA
jgi:ATP-dependent Clp protease ATP-binding subunit ClpA